MHQTIKAGDTCLVSIDFASLKPSTILISTALRCHAQPLNNGVYSITLSLYITIEAFPDGIRGIS